MRCQNTMRLSGINLLVRINESVHFPICLCEKQAVLQNGDTVRDDSFVRCDRFVVHRNPNSLIQTSTSPFEDVSKYNPGFARKLVIIKDLLLTRPYLYSR